MMSVSRSELKKKIAEILKDADLESTSAKKVRKQLEEDLDTDLSDRKEEVNAVIQEVMDENEEEEDEEGESDAEEEEDDPNQQQQSSDYEPEESPPPPPKKKKKTPAKRKRGDDSDESFEEDDDGSEEEWSASAKSSKSKAKAKKPSKNSRKRRGSDDDSSDEDFKPSKAKRKGGGGKTGFTKPLNLSADLAAIVGKDVAPRHEVVKQMWAYIKENKLQDPKNKQFAICDEKLKKVIGETKFKCFGMAKYLKSHMS